MSVLEVGKKNIFSSEIHRCIKPNFSWKPIRQIWGCRKVYIKHMVFIWKRKIQRKKAQIRQKTNKQMVQHVTKYWCCILRGVSKSSSSVICLWSNRKVKLLSVCRGPSWRWRWLCRRWTWRSRWWWSSRAGTFRPLSLPHQLQHYERARDEPLPPLPMPFQWPSFSYVCRWLTRWSIFWLLGFPC